ncbi:group II intron maturase-specific domain-containing protein [Nocardia sp. NPDC046763]|uniref:group II intron maturase-specific domain-containing protein n=1 Tax=Nocardia sp. NPDC046763 TaxID=3155256 RepID=UPI0033E626AC
MTGTRADCETLRDEIAGVLATMGLRLSEEKTLITHIDEGLDFLGWRIQRRIKRGTAHRYVYTYPAKKAVKSAVGKVKTICRASVTQPLAALIHHLNSMLRGWCAYFRPGVSSRTFAYLRAVVWRYVFAWLRRKHTKATWQDLRRRYCDGGWWPHDGEVKLYNPAAVRTTRYRYRGAKIPSPWPAAREDQCA